MFIIIYYNGTELVPVKVKTKKDVDTFINELINEMEIPLEEVVVIKGNQVYELNVDKKYNLKEIPENELEQNPQ